MLPPDKFVDRSTTLTGFKLDSYIRRKSEVTGKLVEFGVEFECWLLLGKLKELEWDFYSDWRGPCFGIVIDFLALSLTKPFGAQPKPIFGYVVLVDEQILLIEDGEFSKAVVQNNEV